MKKVCCFGEVLLRMSPDANGEWLEKNTMPVYLGGAELNVATALALWNVPVKYVSGAPDNYLTPHITAKIASKGIDTTDFIYSGNRIGMFYLPQGSELKNAGVIYDRAHSSFYELKPGQVDWEKILENVSWFHISAISPAVSADAAEVCKEVLQIASAKNITVSIDLNYRAKLWKYGKQPAEIIPDLVQYCDVIMGNLWAADQMLGITLETDLQRTKDAFLEQAKKSSISIIQMFPKCKMVANTFRMDEEASVTYYATLFTDDQFYCSKEHTTNKHVDKIGSGDCFMAGLIYGNTHKFSPQKIIDYAAAAAFDKLFIHGDATTSSAEDIIERIKADDFHSHNDRN